MRSLAVVSIPILTLSACAAMIGNQQVDEEVEPFEPRRVAWSLLLEETPQLAQPSKGDDSQGRLGETLAAFYEIVESPSDDRDSRELRQKCTKAWGQLAREARVNKELAAPLASAQGYLGVECGQPFARRAVPVLTRFVKRHDERNLAYYSGRFWLAEAYLELNQTSKALTQYRYVLGELETPLYPLALLRTAHCYWDDGEAEQAQTHMQYVMDWIGDRTEPRWVRSLKRQVVEDMSGFSQ